MYYCIIVSYVLTYEVHVYIIPINIILLDKSFFVNIPICNE
jgi:hypothetical protein